MTPADLIAAGWTRKGLIWHPPADFVEPPDEELEALELPSDNRLRQPCGTPAARTRHRRAGVRCIVCEAATEAARARSGYSRRQTA